MRFKIDENLPVEVADELRLHNYDAVTVHEQFLQGYADDYIAKVCKNEERIFITLDLDFADIRAYPPQDYPVIIVFRLFHQNKLNVIKTLLRLIPILKKEPLVGYLWIIDEHRVRIRGSADD